MPRVHRLLSDRRGSVAVQFALGAPILVTLLLGVLESGRLFWTWTTIQYAAEETGRYALAHPGTTAADLVEVAQGKLQGLAPGGVSVNVTPETAGGVPYMNITTQFSFSFIGWIPGGTIDLQGRSRVPVVVDPSS